jgi:hypothetical protein
MPRKIIIPESYIKQHPNASKLGHIYSVDQSVGSSGANKKDDVLLIQLMMSVVAPNSAMAQKAEGNATLFGPVPLDGKWNLETLGWILAFQLMWNHWGDMTELNGRCDPVEIPNSLLFARRHMMMQLNVYMADHEQQIFRDISKAPGVPAQLSLALR